MKNPTMGRKSWPSVTPQTSRLSLAFVIIFTLLSCINSSCCNASSPSCGNILNISCPFTLKGNHQRCNASFFSYELSCIKNRTVLYLFPDKLAYYVESINYYNHSIRLVDPGIQKNNSFSRPIHSITDYVVLVNYVQYTYFSDLYQPITRIACPFPVKSIRYINITSPNYVYSFTYIVAGMLYVPEIENNCRINTVTWVSQRRDYIFSNMSEIHDALLYGFELRWSYFYCLNGSGSCFTFNPDHHLWACTTPVPTPHTEYDNRNI